MIFEINAVGNGIQECMQEIAFERQFLLNTVTFNGIQQTSGNHPRVHLGFNQIILRPALDGCDCRLLIAISTQYNNWYVSRMGSHPKERVQAMTVGQG